jgi:Spy/CpxP family protein refolding chaperone
VNPYWRNLIVMIVLAGAAGAAGGWLGSRPLGEADALSLRLPLRETVSHIVANELDLTSAQRAQIAEIDKRYYAKREGLRVKILASNAALADALIADMAYGRAAQEASTHIQAGLGELQRATILYVLELRDVLTPDQRTIYDRKVRASLTAK